MVPIAKPLAGMYEWASVPIGDDRGCFTRLFCAEELRAAYGNRPIVQINHSLTREVGSIRGLHLQRAPYAEAKWIRCLNGRVWDVAVDLRRASSTFLRWHAVELDAKIMNAVLVPEGCAHGFQVLEPDSELLYLHSAPYTPEVEFAVRWDDPKVGVAWPLPASVRSVRDRSHPLLADDFEGLEF